MALILSEEEKMLKSSAKEFLAERSPVEALRRLRDSKDSYGYDRSLWMEMAEMGWTALTIDEAYGGLGFGYVGLGQIMEECGRTLAASPMVSTALLGTTVISLGGSEAQKQALLPEIMEGSMITALAFEEKNSHRPFDVSTTAEKSGDGYTITGKKVFVLDGHVADKLIVSAMADGELSLFIVDAKASGVSIERKFMMDSRNAANVSLEGVAVKADDRVGGKEVLEKSLDIARICLSAEMVGTMQEAFDRTIAYLKERQQFGVPIGSFQALQHRAAHMFSEIELCKAMTLKCLQAIDKNDKYLAAKASMLKAKVGEVLKLVSNEGVQMFGGIGVTDDEEIGFFMKRARVAQQTFGDYNYHLDRFATINGF